jgi:hypothetical protein
MTDLKKNSGAGKLNQFFRENGIGLLGYFLATLFTNAHFMADTADYVESIVAYNGGQYYEFWEFGHVLWRPLGWVLLRASNPLTSLLVVNDLRASGTLVLMTVNWVAGLVSVLALAAILRRFCLRLWVINVTLIAFILSHGFLNYAQTGAPYMLSVSLLLLALYILLRKDKGQDLMPRDGIIAGVAIAGMICFWFPFAMAVPAILCAPLLLSPPTGKKIRVLILCAIVGAALVCVAYAAVAAGGVGVYSISGFRHWMQQTTGQSAQDKGLARTVFGFARSLIYMGNDGMLFKRYLIHDPFNAVTAFDLLRLSLWKMVLFYLFLGAILFNLLRSSEGKRVLVLFAVNAIPVIGLAVYWQGGDIERYLALYPVLFIVLAYSLCHARSVRWLNYLALLFVIAASLTNTLAMSKHALNHEQEAQASRIRDLTPLLKPSSRIYVVTFQDQLFNFYKSFPFNPINRAGTLKVLGLIEVGGKVAPQWRQDFAVRAQSVWERGGDVWLSKRVLSRQPLSKWNWVEGDDKRVSWKDINGFFSPFEMGQSVGGDDGFVLLLPSPKNRLLLSQNTDANQAPTDTSDSP